MCGYQASRAQLFGRKKSRYDAMYEEMYGHGEVDLPGYEERTDEGGAVQTFTHPTFDEVESQLTPFFVAALDLWRNMKRLGCPYGSGWANEKATVIEIYNVLENASNEYDAWDWERKSDKD